METPKINHWYTKPPKAKKFVMPSLTVPDLEMSMSQMIKRHTEGLGVLGHTPVWASEIYEELGKDPRALDLVQKQELHAMLTERLNDKKRQMDLRNQEIEVQRKAREAAKRKEAIEELKREMEAEKDGKKAH
jgi:hypothetical protein